MENKNPYDKIRCVMCGKVSFDLVTTKDGDVDKKTKEHLYHKCSKINEGIYRNRL